MKLGTVALGSAILSAGILLTAACSQNNTAASHDQAVLNQALDAFQRTQPIPQATWSQMRESLIQIENARIHGIATTTFFYNMGSNVPIKSCASTGFPIPATAQLTNPSQLSWLVANQNTIDGVIGQMEPNGTFTGDSAGTYVTCAGPNGSTYETYWEGPVETEGGPAHYDPDARQIVLDGAPTVTAKGGK
jgi:hypothetical protein